MSFLAALDFFTWGIAVGLAVGALIASSSRRRAHKH
jgi:hypothetical protein|uniref:Uncharacterized protein n=1 Tax=Leptospirillum ferriphilum TaxID=178606 RepID=A0A2I2MDR4_9BACT